MRILLLLLALLMTPLAATLPAQAVNPSEMLEDPTLEKRAREISKELRCLVCQNESIDDSDAQLARDLRVLVRERLADGSSDQEVIDYVVSRYGDFVLLNPPFKGTTYVLWIGPLVIGAIGALALILFFRRRARTAPAAAAPLTEDEDRKLKSLLDGDAP